MNRIFLIPVIVSISLFLVALENEVNAQEQNQILETNKVTVEYPNGWTGEANTNRFDSQDFQISKNTDSGKILIIGSDGTFDSEYLKENPDYAYDSFLRGAVGALVHPNKVKTYELGDITISDNPAYASLYGAKIQRGGDLYGVLIVLAFYDDNERYYAITAGAPSDIYDSVEPQILNILKSISFND